MGSPALDLKVSPRLRPWLDAGLEHVFGIAPERLQHVANAGVQLPSPGTSRVSPHDASKPVSQPQAAASHAPPLPEPWSQYWNKATPGAEVVLTYHDLAYDLSGQADPRRGTLFREVLHYLGWMGKEVVSFWPAAALMGQELSPSEPLFWTGTQAIGAQHVVCFGWDAFEIITGKTVGSVPQTQATVFKLDKATVHVLPSPAEMIKMLPHERHLAVESLKSLRLSKLKP